jgi:hypothetical protein
LRPLADDIRPELLVDERRAPGGSGLDVDDGRERLVVHGDELGGVTGPVAVGGHHHRDRLSHEPDAIGGKRAEPTRPRQPGMLGEKRDGSIGGAELSGRDDRDHARSGGRPTVVDGSEPGMRVGRTNHRHVQAARHREVVQELSASRDETWILAAADHVFGAPGHEMPL